MRTDSASATAVGDDSADDTDDGSGNGDDGHSKPVKVSHIFDDTKHALGLKLP